MAEYNPSGGVTTHDIAEAGRCANLGLLMIDVPLQNFGTAAAPAATGTTDVVNAGAAGALDVETTHTIAAQPDVSRTLIITQTDGSNNVGQQRVTVAGKDFHGRVVSETKVFGVGTSTATTSQPFYSDVTVKSKITKGTNTGVTISVGYAGGLQLPADIKAVTDVLKKRVDTTAEAATSTLNTRYSTWTPTSAPDGTRKYWVTMRSTVDVLP